MDWDIEALDWDFDYAGWEVGMDWDFELPDWEVNLEWELEELPDWGILHPDWLPAVKAWD